MLKVLFIVVILVLNEEMCVCEVIVSVCVNVSVCVIVVDGGSIDVIVCVVWKYGVSVVRSE